LRALANSNTGHE
jgi:hypothetical protein